MQYNICVPFMLDFPYNDDIKEFDIVFNHLDDSLEDLMVFLKTYNDRRINIFSEVLNISIDLMLSLIKINPNIYFKLDIEEFHRAEELQSKNIKFYFNFFVNSWDALWSFKNSGVAEIYITDELGFNLKNIKKLLGEDIKLRAFVNLSQKQDPFKNNEDIKSFFIRPEDLEAYSNYINSFEFVYEDKTQIKTLYKIYSIDKKWKGYLSTLIVNFSEVVNNTNIPPSFAQFRLNCDKKCYKKENGCNLCIKALELAMIMDIENLSFNRSE